MTTDVVQKAFVINQDGDILLVKRSATDTRRPLTWDLPGGVLDPNESLEDSVLREIEEETGIKAHDPEIFFTKTIISTWNRDGIDHERNVVKSYYSVHVDTIDVVLSYEHSEFCWVSLDEAYELLSYDQHKEVVKHAIDNQLEL
jgi:8-oxo-dGTP pyrophosphatase MutT (NUDIX family)